MQELFSCLQNELSLHHNTILMCVIGETGSTPRGVGAMMLINEDGQLAGTIGGGPAEYQGTLLAQKLLAEKRSGFHEYILRQNITEDIGSECGGSVTVLFQFVDASDDDWVQLIEKTLLRLNSHQAGYFLLARDGSSGALIDGVGQLLCGNISNAASYCTGANQLSDTFFSLCLPVGEQVYLFGGGHCSKALCPVLTNLGFRVTVFDDREEYITQDRFPQAVQRICGSYDHLEDSIQMTSDDYVVIMTTGHKNDFTVEKYVLSAEIAYVGCIGSRNKVAAVNRRLREFGFTDEKIQEIHSPIGLAISAVTPEEIAISVAAEMIQVRAQHRKEKENLVLSCPMLGKL